LGVARHRITTAAVAGLAALAVALLPAGAGAAQSCDRYAAPGGSDSAPGTEAAPLRSAQELVDSLSPGQTGCLRAGDYDGVDIRRGGRVGAPITLRNYPGEKATVTGRFWVVRTAPYVVVEGLYLNGKNETDHPSPTINASDVTFRRNDVTNDHTAICFLIGSTGEWGRGDRAVIEDNRVHDCGVLPARGLNHGVYVEASTGSRVVGNWFYDNSDYAVHLYPDADATLVRGNVIDGNGRGITISGDGGEASDSNRIEGNVITNSKDRFNVEAWWPQGNPTPANNLVAGNCLKAGPVDWEHNGGVETSRGFSVRDNTIALDPGFGNRARHDLRLRQGSECRAKLAGDPEAVPGPDSSLSPLPAAPPVTLRAKKRSVRKGSRVRLTGRVARPLHKGGRITIVARAGGRKKVLARTAVKRGGRFAVQPRMRVRGKVVRVKAVMRGVGSSRAVRLRVRG
jgi:parallel beta helix pectate lyase-like protein